MGPLLFLIYINDLHLTIKSSEVYHFADDTHLLHFNESLKSLCNKVNSDLKLLGDWLNANKISLNTDKTEFILFRSRFNSLPFKPFLKIAGKKIFPSSSVKYLGVYLDEHLTFSTHIANLSLKLQRANGVLSKLRHYVPLKILVGIYYALFNSHLQYACQTWGLCDTSISHRILTLQKSAIRLMMTFSNNRTPSSSLFLELKILKVFDLVKVLNILFIHQYLNSMLPVDTLNTFTFQNNAHLYDTRSNELGLLTLPTVKSKSYGINSLSKCAISQWNFFQKAYSNTNLVLLSHNKLKSIATSFYLNSYDLNN